MRIVVPLALAFWSLAAVAQLYSWKDASGQVQYSDQPPPGQVQPRKLPTTPAPATDPAEARRRLAEQQIEFRKKQKEAEQAADKATKEKAEAEERRGNCEKSKANLAGLESGQIRYTTNAKGERVPLEGAVLEAELASAHKSVEGWCK